MSLSTPKKGHLPCFFFFFLSYLLNCLPLLVILVIVCLFGGFPDSSVGKESASNAAAAAAAKSLQSCPTLCDPMDCSLPGFSIHGILQARTLEWVAISFSNTGDCFSIPGLGRSTGEGIGYQLQYSWASLVAQLVKNLLAIWETWVRSLGWKAQLAKNLHVLWEP